MKKTIYTILSTFALLMSIERAESATYDFSKVDKLLSDSVSAIQGQGNGCALVIIKDGKEIYNKSFGSDYSADKVAPIASATKWLSGATIMALVDAGKLSLSDTIGKFISEISGAIKPTISIRQLMSHTSGFAYGDSKGYHEDKTLTLEAAVDSICLNESLIAMPGAQFNYGGISMQVAGRIAEIASGLKLASGTCWKTIFSSKISTPLGLTKTNYSGLGITDNPQIAGGAMSSASDYIKFLQMLLNGGKSESGETVLSQSAIDALVADETNGAEINYSPYMKYGFLDSALPYSRYGIGNWLENTSFSGARLDNASQGAFGFSPWIDWNRNLVAVFSVFSQNEIVAPTYLEMKRLINEALDNPTSVNSDIEGNYLLYPNPSSAFVNINTDSAPLSISIFDALGMQVNSAQNTLSEKLTRLDLQNIPAGSYTVRMQFSNQTKFYKLIKK